MGKAISIQNLEKIYKPRGKSFGTPVHAIRDLTLSVEEGDIYGFIGPNGAGKTTTIKILMGLITPSSGSATILSHKAGTVDAKKKIGFLSEVAHYYPFMEVGKLLDFYCSFFEIPPSRRKERIDEVLSMVNLSEKKFARMNELSKGMTQRFGIAQAIIADPPLLILDELTSGLDPIAQKEVKDIVLALKNRGKTIFFSSHQMTEVENICDKIGIIHRGVLKKTAGLEEFLVEESGGKSVVVFSSDNGDMVDQLREIKLDVNNVRSGVYSIVIPDTDVNPLIDDIQSRGGKIKEVAPHRYSLEDAFFKLIKEDAN